MKCPHCAIEVHPTFTRESIGSTGSFGTVFHRGSERIAIWAAHYMQCPACARAVVELEALVPENTRMVPVFRRLVHPKAATRPKAANGVPPHLAEDFNEACLVIGDSPKASAALSRRCLQAMLRDQGFKEKDLAPAIDAVLASKTLPGALAHNLDAIRNIGNFAAHPLKDTNSGAILPVEPEEAEWNLDVLEGLFDFYYVEPAKAKARRDALNVKLQAAGKPPMK
jgi:hypothetical protein